MTIEAEFLELMVDTVVITTATGVRNLYAREGQSSTSASYRGRYVRRNQMVRDDAGDEVVSRSQLWLFGAPSLTPRDKITLPDGTTPVILAVERYPDDNGAHHEKVFFGS